MHNKVTRVVKSCVQNLMTKPTPRPTLIRFNKTGVFETFIKLKLTALFERQNQSTDMIF